MCSFVCNKRVGRGLWGCGAMGAIPCFGALDVERYEIHDEAHIATKRPVTSQEGENRPPGETAWNSEGAGHQQVRRWGVRGAGASVGLVTVGEVGGGHQLLPATPRASFRLRPRRRPHCGGRGFWRGEQRQRIKALCRIQEHCAWTVMCRGLLGIHRGTSVGTGAESKGVGEEAVEQRLGSDVPEL